MTKGFWWRIKEKSRFRRPKPKPERKLSCAEQLQKENDGELKLLAWECLFYSVFLLLVIGIAYNNRDDRAWRYQDTIVDAVNGTIDKMGKVVTVEGLWNWTSQLLIPFLYADVNWAGKALNHSLAVSDLSSYRLGPLRIRQHRAKNRTCTAYGQLGDLDIRCVPTFNSGKRDWSNYREGWVPVENTDPYIADMDRRNRTMLKAAWTYKSWHDIGGMFVLGDRATYPPGGYLIEIVTENKAVALHTVSYLKEHHWVDTRSGVVIMEATLYNPNVNLYSMFIAIFEFSQTMKLQAKVYAHPFRLWSYTKNYPARMIIMDLLFYLAIIWFAAREILKAVKGRSKYFKDFWNYLSILNLLVSIASMCLFIGRLVITDDLSRAAKDDKNEFYNFQTLAVWDKVFTYLIALVTFLSMVQILHVLRFNRRMAMLGATLKTASPDLGGFWILYVITYVAFSASGTILFGKTLLGYRNIIASMETMVRIILGEIEHSEMFEANASFAHAFLIVYNVWVVFLLINILITILIDSFSVVRENANTVPNDYELMDYLVDRTKTWVCNTRAFLWLWRLAHRVGIVSKADPGVTRAKSLRHFIRRKTVKASKESLRRRDSHYRFKSRRESVIPQLQNEVNASLESVHKGKEVDQDDVCTPKAPGPKKPPGKQRSVRFVSAADSEGQEKYASPVTVVPATVHQLQPYYKCHGGDPDDYVDLVDEPTGVKFFHQPKGGRTHSQNVLDSSAIELLDYIDSSPPSEQTVPEHGGGLPARPGQGGGGGASPVGVVPTLTPSKAGRQLKCPDEGLDAHLEMMDDFL